MFFQSINAANISPKMIFTIATTAVKLSVFFTFFDTINLSITFIKPQMKGDAIAAINAISNVAMFCLILCFLY
jgi:hypothetical protein